MHHPPPRPDRRRTLLTIAAACCCAGTAHATSNAQSPTSPSVDQITDLSSTAASDMFRFDPDLVFVEPGTEISFLNSRADHTVHSVPQLWPDGVPPVKISHKPQAAVLLPTDGLYAFRCRRHGKYGMVMLVVAGTGSDLPDIPERIDAMRAGAREKEKFRTLIAQYAAERGA